VIFLPRGDLASERYTVRPFCRMVFLVFPEEFERSQFLMALDAAFTITYFDIYGHLTDLKGQRADAFLVRFGRNTQKL